jgi:hypothetical protein
VDDDDEGKGQARSGRLPPTGSLLYAMRPPSPSIPEKDFFSVALAQGLRLDGRGLLTQRPVELAFGTEMGHVEVALGKTRSVSLSS